MSTMHSNFLKEMGITEWTARDSVSALDPSVQPAAAVIKAEKSDSPRWFWWFCGAKPQGDAQILFQNMIRVLGLTPNEWSWKSPNDDLSEIRQPDNGKPVVVLAFGGPAVQKITGERDPLQQLRETILALNTPSEDEIPVLASFDLSQFLAKPQDKALLWQDLLLAKSILQNI